ncbi:hypothetical protein NL676_033654 [Syzygium grande]|nr:hypothetical protein NL676_033654 [Syzygium grande]
MGLAARNVAGFGFEAVRASRLRKNAGRELRWWGKAGGGGKVLRGNCHGLVLSWTDRNMPQDALRGLRDRPMDAEFSSEYRGRCSEIDPSPDSEEGR